MERVKIECAIKEVVLRTMRREDLQMMRISEYNLIARSSSQSGAGEVDGRTRKTVGSNVRKNLRGRKNRESGARSGRSQESVCKRGEMLPDGMDAEMLIQHHTVQSAEGAVL